MDQFAGHQLPRLRDLWSSQIHWNIIVYRIVYATTETYTIKRVTRLIVNYRGRGRRLYPLFIIIPQVGAYCYAELGCMISKSGADYAYIMETFGPFIAFMRLWVECMIVRPCSQAIVALTFSLYVLKPMYTDCDPPEESTRLLAACCIGNYRSSNYST